jgi:hypothetical protein
LAQEQIDEEKKRWEVGVEVGIQRFKVYVAREIDKIGKLTKPTEKSRKFSLLKRDKSESPDYRELREEFRSFLRTTKDNVDLYLWFALSNLAERGVARKLEAKVYQLFGHVASTFLYIEQNFDPSEVTPDLLSFLKDRITRIGSPGAFDITGRSSVITQSGEGENNFLESVNYLQKLLAEVRTDLSKYFKKDESFESTSKSAMR